MINPLIEQVLLWCLITNAGFLALSFLVLAFMGDTVYRWHSRWFPMPRETFNAIIYAFLGVYKLLIIVFNFVPWLVLKLMS